ncbi:B12-binding domain-containing radical SAM protein [Nonomuraea glycinis]|uniref:B12-binding domain-containing radical SAM protein n=1 Tax=Nonomuraea glycinis TaxID=2047744 RepID=UPI00339F8750
MILARAADRHGLTVRILDLNIEYFRSFQHASTTVESAVLGDHGKDRAFLVAAAEHFFRSTNLPADEALHLPDTADAIAGMHFGFETLARATAEDSAFWSGWLEDALSHAAAVPPPVVGISVMGPSQVFVALVVARLVKRRWPRSVTVLGGSHVTLLAAEMGGDPRYLEHVDVVLPGHSEEEFAALVASVRKGRRRSAPGIAAPPSPARSFDYHPLATAEQLRSYDPATLTMPLQFTRGCSYGRCTFCTYPVVEPVVTPLHAARAAETIGALAGEHGLTRFSVKDSLFTVPMMIALAEALTAAGIRAQWSATTKATRSLIAHAPRLAAAGLVTLEIGVETVHPDGQRLFDKTADPGMIEDVVHACTDSGIAVVVNLIFGLPGESLGQAERQLDWFVRQRDRAPAGMVDGSLNMLEIVRGSPLELRPPAEVDLYGVAPWAYCYAWNAPAWRPEFAGHLRTMETRQTVLTRPAAACADP